MNPRVKTLANQMKALRDKGESFVLMLGAGASMSSGIPATQKIITELLEKFGGHLQGSDPMDRFDKLWTSATPDDRDTYLQPYLDKDPGEGFHLLAELMREGYFDTVVTFNFDRLLEKALTRAGMLPGDDFLAIVRGDHTNESVLQMMDRQKPKTKLLKLHGSLTGGNTFLFSDVEMLNYPDPIRDLLKALTGRHIIVCGYGFEDTCVERAFAEQGGPIYCVNPGGAPRRLRAFIRLRNSTDFTIDGETGKFDNFMTELHEALAEPEPQPTRQIANPFKYLGSLSAEDNAMLYGRDRELDELLRVANSDKPVFVMGPSKAGKTSLARAGLLARLDPNQYVHLYLRCRNDIAAALETLRVPLQMPPDRKEVGPMLAWVSEWAAKQNKRAILVLDQFERIHCYEDTKEGIEKLTLALRPLLEARNPNLTVFCLIADHAGFTNAILRLKNLWEGPVSVYELDRSQVRDAVHTAATGAGVAFEDAVYERIADCYQKNGFTLAHVQALCAVLCERSKVDVESFEKTLDRERPVLNIVINSCDIVNLIEDVPPRDAALLRKIIRNVAHPECNERIVECVKQVNELSNPSPRASAAGTGK